MKARAGYKGFVLDVMSFELREMPGFTSELYIETHDGPGVNVERFIMPGIYESNESAVQSAFLAGRHKIDNGYAPSA
jgi:hypothetical protein